MTSVHLHPAPRTSAGALPTLTISWRFAERGVGGAGGRLQLRVDLPPPGTASGRAMVEAWVESGDCRESLLPASMGTATWVGGQGSHADDLHLEVRFDQDVDALRRSTPATTQGTPEAIVALFRRGRLTYLRTLVPALASLAGGTYELESWALEGH